MVVLCRQDKLDNVIDGGLRSPTQVHGVATCGNVFDAVDDTGKDGGCCYTASSHLVGLLSDILDEAGPERALVRGEDVRLYSTTYQAPRFSNSSLRVMVDPM